MKFPNPYEHKDYRRMFVVPLVLVLLALYFIPSIPQGIELKGGTLLTVFTKAPNLDAKGQELEGRLGAYSKSVSVRSFRNPSGQGLEIELQLNPALEKVEDRLAILKNLQTAYGTEALALDGLRQNKGTDSEIAAAEKKVAAAQAALLAESTDLLAALGRTPVQDPEKAYDSVEAALQDEKTAFRDKVLAEVKSVVTVDAYSSQEIGAALSRFFFGQVTNILFLSFLLSAGLIILIFRSFVPSLAVLFGAFCDIVITLGVMGLFQIPLSLATVSALLMLVGFSLDTDMLLTIRVLKRTEGTAKQRAFDTFKTAALMNACAVAAFSVLVLVAGALQIQTYQQIGMVILIGAVVDFIATWCGNAVMVVWQAEQRGMA